MRAQNLAISIPPGQRICDKHCEYCVSKMTGYLRTNRALMQKNLPKVKELAHVGQVTSVLLTGKGEPTMSQDDLFWMLNEFRHLPTELQTNGKNLSKNHAYLTDLAHVGLNTLAVSIDMVEIFKGYRNLFARAKDLGMITRVTLNITNKIQPDITFKDLIFYCCDNSVDQLMLRNVVVPSNVSSDSQEARWIQENVDPGMYHRLQKELRKSCEEEGMMIRRLNFGSVVYDYQGVSVTYSDYCVQDDNDGKDIRSLIFMEDGHCYTSWNSQASILF